MNHDHHHEHGHTMNEMVFEVVLKDKKQIAEGSMAFLFEKPAGFEFRAGQHTTVTLINPPQTDAEGNSRHFSMVHTPADEDIAIATRMRDTAFKRVLGNMNIGDKVQMEKPHGSFILHQDTSKPAVFLIGGIGITPVYSIIKDATERKLPHRIFLFYSNRRQEDAAFLKELEDLATQNPSFTLIATVTDSEKSKNAWNGETGYIDQAMLRKYVNSLQIPIYYISGPPAMVSAMRKLLTDSDVNEDNIKTEEFSGY